MKELTPAQRLILAADFDPAKFGGVDGLRPALVRLLNLLLESGVTIKLNSLLRYLGSRELIPSLQGPYGMKVMADLKLCDIPETMRLDAAMLAPLAPSIVTVMACASIKGMMAVRQALPPETMVFAVTVLTSLDEDECQSIFGCSTKAGVLRFARMAKLAGVDGLICSPKEVELIRSRPELNGLILGTPGIRPSWAPVPKDDQSRVLTPAEAIKLGADLIVVGRPITQSEDPRTAVERTIAEIEAGLLAAGR